MNTIRLLALSGSLREASYNTAALKALQRIAPAPVEITIGAIGGLPLFNPDREGEDIPALAALSGLLGNSDGLILASPEYAHGISGPLKNALDWLVGGVEFPYKPVMLVNTSPRASHAQAALTEVVSTMSGHVVERACISIPLLSSGLDVGGIVGNKEMVRVLDAGLGAFCTAIEARRGNKRLD